MPDVDVEQLGRAAPPTSRRARRRSAPAACTNAAIGLSGCSTACDEGGAPGVGAAVGDDGGPVRRRRLRIGVERFVERGLRASGADHVEADERSIRSPRQRPMPEPAR